LLEVARLGVTHFHLSHCLAASGEFVRCDEPTRNYLVTQFSKIAGKHNLTAILSAVDQDDWDEMRDDSSFFRAFPTPVALCFENLVRELAIWGTDHAVRNKIKPVFAHREEWVNGKGLGAPILHLYGGQDWYNRHLAEIEFDYPSRSIPLQAADLIAGLLRRSLCAATPYPEQALRWATDGKFTYGSIFGRDALKRTIERFNLSGEIYSMP
jgi:hypothetical protein